MKQPPMAQKFDGMMGVKTEIIVVFHRYRVCSSVEEPRQSGLTFAPPKRYRSTPIEKRYSSTPIVARRSPQEIACLDFPCGAPKWLPVYIRVFAILSWKTCNYYYETDKLPNPRSTQPKKS